MKNISVYIFPVQPMKANFVALHSSCNSGKTLWSNDDVRKLGKKFIWKHLTTEGYCRFKEKLPSTKQWQMNN